ncbi:MAG: carbohydrate ABC transporter permease [Chloroflexota bacterium]|nr:carbohydrate ABC transporter permease [Chloroflexota bacterium]
MMQAQAQPRPAWTPPRALSYVLLSILAVATLVPFLWMVDTALKPQSEVMSYPPTWIPSHLAWSNFPQAFTFFPFARFLLNTVIVALGATVLQTAIAILAAYSFARLRFRGRDLLFVLYLGTLMIPQQVTIVPLFLMMRTLGWIDTFWALILPSAFHALGVFLLRQFFMTIPKELEESAFMDGAGRLRILWQVILPLSRPALATLVLFTFIREWNSFLWPLIATASQDMRTVSVGLTLFVGQYGTEWHLMMAAATVTLLPVLLVFAVAQRYYIEGIATTGFGGR